MINKAILKEYHSKGIKENEFYDSYKIFFGTLTSQPRLKIINLLRKKRVNVSEISKELNMDQTTVSHNLARLRACGFVKQEIEHKFRYYSLNKSTILPLMNLIDKHMSKNCIHILRKVRRSKK